MNYSRQGYIFLFTSNQFCERSVLRDCILVCFGTHMLKDKTDQVCSVNCFGVSQAVIFLYTVYPGKIAALER